MEPRKMLIVRQLMNNKQILSQASLVEGLYIRMNSGGDRKSRTATRGRLVLTRGKDSEAKPFKFR